MPVSDALDTNLLRSNRGKAPDAASVTLPPDAVAARRKRLLKGAAYAIFFAGSLVTFTLLKIPDSVVTNLLLNQLNQSTPYQWQAERIGIGFFPFPHLEMEKLDLEPKFAGAGPALLIDEVRIYPNPFSLIPIGGGSAFGGSFRAEAYKAVVHGSFAMGKDLYVRVETDSIDLGKIAPLTALADLKGALTSLDFRISLPNQRLGNADGEVSIKAKNVQFDPTGFNLPVALPALSAGDVDIEGTISHGQVKIDKFKLGGAGKDIDLQIPNGTVNLSDSTPATRYDLHLQLKPSPTLEKAVPGLAATMAVFATLKPDGYYATRVQGTLGAPGFPAKD